MSVARIVELVGKSKKSWEDACLQALKESKIKNAKCIDVKRLKANIENGKIKEFKANIKVAVIE